MYTSVDRDAFFTELSTVLRQAFANARIYRATVDGCTIYFEEPCVLFNPEVRHQGFKLLVADFERVTGSPASTVEIVEVADLNELDGDGNAKRSFWPNVTDVGIRGYCLLSLWSPFAHGESEETDIQLAKWQAAFWTGIAAMRDYIFHQSTETTPHGQEQAD